MPRFSSRALQGASHCLCWLAFFPQCNLVLPVHQLSFLWPLLLDECCSHMLHSKFGSCSSTVCSCQNVGTTMTPKISSFAFQHSTQQHIDSCLLYSDMRRQLRNASCCFNFRGEFSRSEKVFLIIPTTHYRTLSSAIQKKRPAKKDLWYWNCSESSSHHNPVSQIVMIFSHSTTSTSTFDCSFAVYISNPLTDTTETRLSRLYTSPVSGFNVLADWCSPMSFCLERFLCIPPKAKLILLFNTYCIMEAVSLGKSAVAAVIGSPLDTRCNIMRSVMKCFPNVSLYW